ncbi:MAG: hypothetical protein ABJC98_03695, partial [Bacteroidota bacterium]
MRHPKKNNKSLIRAFIILLIFFFTVSCVTAQNLTAVPVNELIFSAIKGNRSKVVKLSLPIKVRAEQIKWVSGDTANFKFEFLKGADGKDGIMLLDFEPPVSFVGISKASVNIRNDAGTVIKINLTGLGTKGLEGENEPALSTIMEAMGYRINVGWTSLANHSRPELQGDEIPFSLFRKAGKGKVAMRPIARYSPDFELPFGYYTNTINGPDKKQAGVLAKAGKYPEHQGLFPEIVPGGSYSFDPGNENFGFYATGPTHSAYSEDVWNMLLYPENAVRAVRIYPVKDSRGDVVKHTYLLCFEEAKNGDYNDYVFMVNNVTPVITDPFTVIFNGKNLNGWHTFIQNKGKNIDPDNNFRIEDSAL